LFSYTFLFYTLWFLSNGAIGFVLANWFVLILFQILFLLKWVTSILFQFLFFLKWVISILFQNLFFLKWVISILYQFWFSPICLYQFSFKFCSRQLVCINSVSNFVLDNWFASIQFQILFSPKCVTSILYQFWFSLKGLHQFCFKFCSRQKLLF